MYIKLDLLRKGEKMHKYISIIEEQAKLHNIKIYMVGGAVRNNILNIPLNDYDFVLDGNCHNFGDQFAKSIGGSYVFMHENVARVVKDDIVFDFCRFIGGTLEDDLKGRDFTINSMALDMRNGKIIDVTGGELDLKNKIIRHNCENVFNSDPLRMLRAVRLSAQLGFSICKETRELIKQRSELLINVSGERILEELLKILDNNESYKYIEMMDYVGLLNVVFPIMKRMKTIGKCRYHVVNAYAHSLLTLRYLEKNICEIVNSQYGKELKEFLNSDVNNKKRIQVIKLASLLHDIGKPDAAHMEGDRVSFKGHNVAGEIVFKAIASRLSMSTKQREIILSVIKGHMRILGMYKHGANNKTIYKLFTDLGDNVIDVLICSLCDVNATRSLLEDNGESRKYWDFVMGLVDKYYSSFLKKQRFINGNDIIEIKGASGINIGKILAALDEQCFYGYIKNRQDAINFIRNVEFNEIM
jgi:poly(A) polymerase